MSLTLIPTLNFLVPLPPPPSSRMSGEEDAEVWRMRDACILGGEAGRGTFDRKSVTDYLAPIVQAQRDGCAKKLTVFVYCSVTHVHLCSARFHL